MARLTCNVGLDVIAGCARGGSIVVCGGRLCQGHTMNKRMESSQPHSRVLLELASCGIDVYPRTLRLDYNRSLCPLLFVGESKKEKSKKSEVPSGDRVTGRRCKSGYTCFEKLIMKSRLTRTGRRWVPTRNLLHHHIITISVLLCFLLKKTFCSSPQNLHLPISHFDIYPYSILTFLALSFAKGTGPTATVGITKHVHSTCDISESRQFLRFRHHKVSFFRSTDIPIRFKCHR